MSAAWTSEELEHQHLALQFDALEANVAVVLGSEAAGIARAASLPVLVEVRLGDRLVYRAALEGTTTDNDDWLRRKFNVVRQFERSSLAMRVRFEEQGTDFHAATGLPEADYAAYGGGWPLVVRGRGMVGVMGVSGLPHLDDHRLIVDALTAVIAR